MSLPCPRQAAGIIIAPCLVQRDRAGRALFISDYPRRLAHGEKAAAEARLTAAGYVLTPLDGLTLLDYSPSAYQACYEALPPARLPPFGTVDPALWGMCRILMRHECGYALQDADVLRRAMRLHLLDREQALYTLLAESLADALRELRGPPAYGARLLALRLNKPHDIKGGSSPC